MSHSQDRAERYDERAQIKAPPRARDKTDGTTPAIQSPVTGDTVPPSFLVVGGYDSDGVNITVSTSAGGNSLPATVGSKAWSTTLSGVGLGTVTVTAVGPNASTPGNVSGINVVSAPPPVEITDVTDSFRSFGFIRRMFGFADGTLTATVSVNPSSSSPVLDVSLTDDGGGSHTPDHTNNPGHSTTHPFPVKGGRHWYKFQATLTDGVRVTTVHRAHLKKS
jgi:hypothetical protein